MTAWEDQGQSSAFLHGKYTCPWDLARVKPSVQEPVYMEFRKRVDGIEYRTLGRHSVPARAY